jgi:hypothetical protein
VAVVAVADYGRRFRWTTVEIGAVITLFAFEALAVATALT